MRRYATGQGDHCLLLSIIAVTNCQPTATPEDIATGVQCAELAQALALKELERPSIIKTQALLLIVRYYVWRGAFPRALMLMAPLTRFAFALRINYENPSLCFLAQESRRRLMWSIYILDTMLAGGIPEFTLCSSSVIHLQLPCPEADFELDNAKLTESLAPSPEKQSSADLGLLVFYIRIVSLRDRVLR